MFAVWCCSVERCLSLRGHISTRGSWSGHAVQWAICTCSSHPIPSCCCWTEVAFSLSVELTFLHFYHGSFLSNIGFTTWNCVAEPPGDCIMPCTGTQENTDRDIISGILQWFHSCQLCQPLTTYCWGCQIATRPTSFAWGQCKTESLTKVCSGVDCRMLFCHYCCFFLTKAEDWLKPDCTLVDCTLVYLVETHLLGCRKLEISMDGCWNWQLLGLLPSLFLLSARSVETFRFRFLEYSTVMSIFWLRRCCLKFTFDQGIDS